MHLDFGVEERAIDIDDLDLSPPEGVQAEGLGVLDVGAVGKALDAAVLGGPLGQGHNVESAVSAYAARVICHGHDFRALLGDQPSGVGRPETIAGRRRPIGCSI